MKAATPSQMSMIDKISIEEFGIPGIILMENAALKVVEETLKTIGELAGKRVVLVAGKGNNGGDAFAAARHLFNRGTKLEMFLVGSKASVRGDALTNLLMAEKLGIRIFELTKENQLPYFKESLDRADVVIDGIFGTGLKGEVKGMAYDVIRIVNEEDKIVISIDIPSGLNGENGQVQGICIKAEKTVTFGLPKTGLLCYPGRDYTGELIIADIGIPAAAVEKAGINTYLIDRAFVLKSIPSRKNDSNKGDYGRVLVIGGSTGMTGACSLCAYAVLKTGAGLVYAGVPASLSQCFDASVAEAVTLPLDDNGSGRLVPECIDKVISELKNKNVAAIGPGISMNGDTKKVVYGVIESCGIPLVIDADGLNSVADNIGVLKSLKTEAVLTPHPGEMARLCGISAEEIQKNRISVAGEFSSKWNVILVLKGAATVVAIPDGTVYINSSGNPGMATAGAGDVLTGVIAGLAGQGLSPREAAVSGVYLHGLAGDIAAKQKGQHGIVATDILEGIPYAVKSVLEGP